MCPALVRPAALWSYLRENPKGWINFELFHSDRHLVCLTCWGGECYVKVPSPGVCNTGLHLHMFQWFHCILLPFAGFSWNLYGDLTCCFQLPAQSMKRARNEHTNNSQKHTDSSSTHHQFNQIPKFCKYSVGTLHANRYTDRFECLRSFICKTVNPHLSQTWMNGFRVQAGIKLEGVVDHKALTET